MSSDLRNLLRFSGILTHALLFLRLFGIWKERAFFHCGL